MKPDNPEAAGTNLPESHIEQTPDLVLPELEKRVLNIDPSKKSDARTIMATYWDFRKILTSIGHWNLADMHQMRHGGAFHCSIVTAAFTLKEYKVAAEMIAVLRGRKAWSYLSGMEPTHAWADRMFAVLLCEREYLPEAAKLCEGLRAEYVKESDLEGLEQLERIAADYRLQEQPTPAGESLVSRKDVANIPERRPTVGGGTKYSKPEFFEDRWVEGVPASTLCLMYAPDRCRQGWLWFNGRQSELLHQNPTCLARCLMDALKHGKYSVPRCDVVKSIQPSVPKGTRKVVKAKLIRNRCKDAATKLRAALKFIRAGDMPRVIEMPGKRKEFVPIEQDTSEYSLPEDIKAVKVVDPR